jgi:hypothetical protein
VTPSDSIARVWRFVATHRRRAFGSLRAARIPARACLAIVAGMLLTAPVSAQQLPAARLYSLFPPGGQQGVTLDLAITGVDLENASQLRFTHPGIVATQKAAEPGPFQKGPQPIPNQFSVAIAADVPPGVYEARAVGKFGISNPRLFSVGAAPEINETEPNNDLATANEVPLGTTVNGRSNSATDIDCFKFTATAGQRVLVDCWAERLDSRMDGTLAMYDAAGALLAQNRDTNGRDPLLDFSVPADGQYTVKLYDFTYGGGDDYVYRLSIGTAPYIDYVLPPSGPAGASSQFTLYGRNLPGGMPADGVTIDGRPLEKLVVDVALPADPRELLPTSGTLLKPSGADLQAIDYRLVTPQGTSNPVMIGVATAPIILEQEPNEAGPTSQKITVPCEYVGQFQRPGDQDSVIFQVEKGSAWWIEVLSERLGRSTDPHFVLQRVTINDKGEESAADLLESDDPGVNLGGLAFNTTTEDPVLQFTAPDNGTYRVILVDQFYRGDPRKVYRLSIRQPAPEFQLVAVPHFPAAPNTPLGVWTPLLRKGGTEMFDVLAYRRDGFGGEIQLSVEGLPEGVTASPATIGAGQNVTSLVLTAADTAAEWSGEIQIIGKARVGDAEMVRQARAGTAIWDAPQQASSQARAARGVMLAVSGLESAQFLVDAGQNQVWEICRAGTEQGPVKVTRRDGFAGAVALQPINPPPNVPVPALTVNPDQAEVPLAVQVPANAPLGTYTFYMIGTTQVAYRRNPEVAEAAAAFKAELDTIVAQLTEASQKAEAAKTAATTAATEAATKSTTAAEAKAAADKALADAQTAAQVATDAAAAAKTALDADPSNQALIDAKAAADQAAADAAAVVKTAEEAKVAGDKAAEEAAAAATAAEEARVAAEKAAADTAAMLQAATAAQTAAATNATNTATAANPANINVVLPSTAVTIRITASPVQVAVKAPEAAVKQGTEAQVPVTITRLYAYADPVSLELVVPGGVAGIAAAKVDIPAGQNEGVLTITAAADATPGAHTLTVKATANLNGQALPAEQTFPLTIEAAQQ